MAATNSRVVRHKKIVQRSASGFHRHCAFTSSLWLSSLSVHTRGWQHGHLLHHHHCRCMPGGVKFSQILSYNSMSETKEGCPFLSFSSIAQASYSSKFVSSASQIAIFLPTMPATLSVTSRECQPCYCGQVVVWVKLFNHPYLFPIQTSLQVFSEAHLKLPLFSQLHQPPYRPYLWPVATSSTVNWPLLCSVFLYFLTIMYFTVYFLSTFLGTITKFMNQVM